MPAAFDAYHKWLAIPPSEQPPHHYRLLGIAVFESDPDVIANAADRQMSHVKSFQGGPHSAISQRILNEIAAAKICLLSPAKRVAYDAELRGSLAVTPAAADDFQSLDPLQMDFSAALAEGPSSAAAPNRARRRAAKLPWQLPAVIGAGLVACVVAFGYLIAHKPAEPPAPPAPGPVASGPVTSGSTTSGPQAKGATRTVVAEPKTPPHAEVKTVQATSRPESQAPKSEPLHVAASAPAIPVDPWTPWRELFDGRTLTGWEPFTEGNFSGSTARVEGGAIALAPNNGRAAAIKVTAKVPRIGYEIRIESKRVNCLDVGSISFPIGPAQCVLHLGSYNVGGFNGNGCGLDRIDGLGPTQPGCKAARKIAIEAERWYTTRLRVTRDKIAVWLDESQIFDVDTAAHAFDSRYPALTLGLVTWGGKEMIRSVRIRELKTPSGG